MANNEDTAFQELIIRKGRELYRDMPWRDDTRPYYIVVSELMLQQTQVARVIPKFHDFVTRFPDETTLAEADLSDVVRLWQGLGYNRRAKYLHDSAKMIVLDFDGHFPETESELLLLPGVGKNTAGAIRAYSFNQPSIFIETNIRTVYLHHFFADGSEVSDEQIREKLVATIDRKQPRKFYWALMDYGSQLKKTGINNTAQSKSYAKQSALKGSVREIRGMIISALTKDDMRLHDLKKVIPQDGRFEKALRGLEKDTLITMTDEIIHLTK